MRIVFMGSAPLALPSLQQLVQKTDHEVVGVITQPDRPAGRKRLLTPCPVKAVASSMNLRVCTPEKISCDEMVELMQNWQPDLLVVVAYGQYIPKSLISIAPYEAINLHPSLLPAYRGAAPIQWALINGDAQTGVSIIKVAEKMDAGEILKQETLDIDETATAATLHDLCADLGARLLLETIDDIAAGTIVSYAQDESKVVEVRKLNKADGIIDWHQPAVAIHNRIRAFDPWPGSRCTLPSGEILSVWKAVCIDGEGLPGEVLDDALTIATARGALRLLEVQLAGGKRMQADIFLHGRLLQKGMMFR